MTTPATAVDFRAYYDLETYLFDTVSFRFARNSTLSAFDFFCIVMWKANRAKSRVARRLLAHGSYNDLDSAVSALLAEISTATKAKDRLCVLIQSWGFLLPMASAILTVLFPKEFTVFDIRICNIIGDFHRIKDRGNFDDLWMGYSKYCEAVQSTAPQEFSLRDQDRWLWGKSFADELTADIASAFARLESRQRT